jgi:hypothetical protein
MEAVMHIRTLYSSVKHLADKLEEKLALRILQLFLK